MSILPKPSRTVGASSEGLTRAVMAVAAAELADVRVPVAEGDVVAIRMVRNMFDPRDHVDANLPTCLVRYRGGSMDEEGYRSASVDVQFDFEQVADGDDELGIAVLDLLVEALARARTLDARYVLQFPLTWEPVDAEEQSTWPNWTGVIHATYYVPTIGDVSVSDLI